MPKKLGDKRPKRRALTKKLRIEPTIKPRLQLLPKRKHIAKIPDKPLLGHPVPPSQKRPHHQAEKTSPSRTVIYQAYGTAVPNVLQRPLLIKRKTKQRVLQMPYQQQRPDQMVAQTGHQLLPELAPPFRSQPPQRQEQLPLELPRVRVEPKNRVGAQLPQVDTRHEIPQVGRFVTLLEVPPQEIQEHLPEPMPVTMRRERARTGRGSLRLQRPMRSIILLAGALQKRQPHGDARGGDPLPRPKAGALPRPIDRLSAPALGALAPPGDTPEKVG